MYIYIQKKKCLYVCGCQLVNQGTPGPNLLLRPQLRATGWNDTSKHGGLAGLESELNALVLSRERGN